MRILLLLGVVTWHVTSSNAVSVISADRRFSRSIKNFSSNFLQAATYEYSKWICTPDGDSMLQCRIRVTTIVGYNFGNFFYSPISASIGLSMLAFSTRGNTAEQLYSALAISGNDIDTEAEIRSFVGSLVVNFGNVKLRWASKMFLAEGLEPKATFLNTTVGAFRSEAKSVNFREAAETRKTISNWCEAKTNNSIKDLTKNTNINSSTKFVLVNAVYFTGNWGLKFKPDLTTERSFYANGNTEKKVSTMYKSGYYRFGNLPEINATFIELPYKSRGRRNAVSMFIIVPNDINGIVDVKKNLNKVTFDRNLGGQETYLQLYLPKFKIETKIFLHEPLRQLGVTDMFTDKADFSGFDHAPPLMVREIIQKAVIQVDEAGCEAAAALLMTGNPVSADPPPVVYKVDRPFVVVIVTAEGVPLFSAIINDTKV